jgi:CAAX prenyl protease-like protein
MVRSHAGPLIVFMLFLMVPDLIGLNSAAAQSQTRWWLTSPQIWLYPLQTLVCGAVLWAFWRHYQFRPFAGLGLGLLCGIAGIALWIAPGWLYQHFGMSDGWWKHFGFADRDSGFDPAIIKQHSVVAWVGFFVMRFLRLVVVVPLVEEIFWRGFLMRLLVDPDGDFERVPFGTHHNPSLVVVTTLFVLAHAPVDYLGATLYGLLAYWVAIKTKSLGACVLMHAVANLLLGIYVVSTQQWGYW